jgi:hypothetical protein
VPGLAPELTNKSSAVILSKLKHYKEARTMTQKEFEHYLEVFRKSEYFTGCPFETANLIEKMSGDNKDNQILSRALTEGWIEEAAE